MTRPPASQFLPVLTAVLVSTGGCLFSPSGSPGGSDTDPSSTGGSTAPMTSTDTGVGSTGPTTSGTAADPTTGTSGTTDTTDTSGTSDTSGASTAADLPPEPFCGDQIVEPDLNEECDDGDVLNHNACTNFCQFQACGDGFVDLDGGEECDHGGAPGAGCSDDCRCLHGSCGDGVVDPGEECDDRDDATCSSCCQRLTALAFVTSATFPGATIGGVTGGDAACNALAEKAGLPGTYQAWLAFDRGVPAPAMIDFKRPYALVTGEIVAHSLKQLRSGALAAAIHVDEQGVDLGAAKPDACAAAGELRVWTGTDAHGAAVWGENCANWSIPEASGHFGVAGSATAAWSDCEAVAPCDAAARLYCFEVQW